MSFVNDELLKQTQISPDKFWHGFDEAVHELAPLNKKLIDKASIKESLISFKRAGANSIVTYFADQVDL